MVFCGLNPHCQGHVVLLTSASRQKVSISLALDEADGVPRLSYITGLLFAAWLYPAYGWGQGAPRDLRGGRPETQTSSVREWPPSTNPPQSRLLAEVARNEPIGVSLDQSAEATHTAVEGETFEPAQTVAQVGDQYILKGELLGDANLMMASMFAQIEKMPAEDQERARRELLDSREQIMQTMLLPQAIERKVKYLEFLRSLPTEADAKKAEERRKKIQSRANAMFTEHLDTMVQKLRTSQPEQYPEIARQNFQLYRIALVMKEHGIKSSTEPGLDPLLREHGTSLTKQQQAFLESATGQMAIREKVNYQPEITHEQMLSYYHEQEAEFLVPRRAQWEQLTVYFKNFPKESAEPAAWDAICGMGNEVLFGGTPFWAVAQRRSQEKNAEKRGHHDWTTYGDLKISRQINEAVFSLPLNELSPVIQDDEGLHIVRVLDRQEAHTIPFSEAQDDIKEKLKTEILNKAYMEYATKLKERTPIITDFSDSTEKDRVAKPTSRSLGISR